MIDVIRPTCQTCSYWESHEEPRDDQGPQFGSCRRNAPRPLSVAHRGDPDSEEDSRDIWVMTEWPETLREQFCGEHPDFPTFLQKR